MVYCGRIPFAMKKTSAFFAVFLFAFFTTAPALLKAQPQFRKSAPAIGAGRKKASDEGVFDALRNYPLSLPSSSPKTFTIPPVAQIRFIDNRMDSSFIGFRLKKMETEKKYTTNSSLSDALNSCAKSAFLTNGAPGKAGELRIFIKNFWLTSEYVHHPSEESFSDYYKVTFSKTSLWVKMEAFAHINGYYHPVFRIDTILRTLERPEKDFDLVFHQLIELTAVKMNTTFAKNGWRNEQHTWTETQLNDYLQQPFRHKILQDVNPQKGIFFTFNDFLQNTPTYASYVFKQNRLDDFLASNEAPERNIAMKVWGFSNGESVFVRMGGKFYPLRRTRNTFNVLGAYDVTQGIIPIPLIIPAAGGFAYGFDGIKGKARHNYCYYHLDLETGLIY